MQTRVHTAAVAAATRILGQVSAAGMARNQLMASDADRRMLTQAMLR